MEKIYLYNTLNRKKEEFIPIKKNQVNIYHCGPTVYWTQHIGNLRGMTMADLVVRVFKYNNYQVRLVRNYTDVGHLTSDEDEGEDKMAKAAKREKTDPQSIAEKYIKKFEQDMSSLNNLEPDVKPRASLEIPDIIKMVQILLKKGYAYQTNLAIYFDVTKARDYTRLSKQKLEENIAHAGSGEIRDKNKKHPQDFALWFFKAGIHNKALQTWPSPFHSELVENGEGFPGWHIECSVMSQKYLGETFDIHMGGIEHIPVHHTNEIAQSESATGKPFVNYWLHNEHLTVNGQKMSKSQGTAYSLDEIKERGFDPLSLRYFYLQAHYRSKQNFTWEALKSAQSALNKLYLYAIELTEPKIGCAEYENKFLLAINDDFNIPKALAITWDLLKSEYPPSAKAASLFKFDLVLGLNIQTRISEIKEKLKNMPSETKDMISKRRLAREKKNYQEADSLRNKIEKSGFWLEDTPKGTKIIPKLK